MADGTFGRQVVDAALAAGPGWCGKPEPHGPHQVDEWNACGGVPEFGADERADRLAAALSDLAYIVWGPPWFPYPRERAGDDGVVWTSPESIHSLLNETGVESSQDEGTGG